MKILLFGASGLFGINFIYKFSKEHEIIAVLHKNLLDIPNVKKHVIKKLNKKEIINLINQVKCDVVINAAALTNIESCEKHRDLTLNINQELAIDIAYACSVTKKKYIFISTDSLHSGKDEFDTELSEVTPLNFYAKSKAEAEKKILETCSTSLILRTTFYGWGLHDRNSLSDWIISSLRNRISIECYTNIFFTPLYLSELHKIILILIKENKIGIFNISSDERISKFDFANKIAKIFNLDSSLIKESKFFKNEFRVKRPLDLSLSNEKLKSTLNIKINSLEDQISELRHNENKIGSFFSNIK